VQLLSDLTHVFQNPQWLWLLLALPPLMVWDAWRKWGAAGLGRRIASGLLRVLMLAAVVGALADPRWHRRDEVAHVVMVVDRSASVPDDVLAQALERADELRASLGDDVRVGLVLFDDDPEVVVVPGQPWVLPDPVRGEPVEVSDIDEALQLALGLVPAEEGGEIVLFSDGRATGTGPTEQGEGLLAAAVRGVPVNTVVLTPDRGDPAITAVILEEREVRPGASVEGKVEVDGSDEAFSGKVVLRMGDKIIAEPRVDLAAGETLQIPFSHQLDSRAEAGTQKIEAELVPDDPAADEKPANNRGAATLVVGEPPKIRVISGEEHDAKALARALRAERMDVEVVPVGEMTPQHEDLTDVDLVVLANAPAFTFPGGKAMTPQFVEKLTHYVDGGGGLVVLGGPMSYDMGGYADSELARILPVRLDQVDPEVESAATIVIMLDKSGSMSAYAGLSKTKMELADEGAVASIRLLRPFDKIAVASVTEVPYWDISLRTATNPAAIEREVLKIRADGGGIYVYTALDAARSVMKKTDTPLRHVILFSDAADSEEKVKGIPFGTGAGHTCEDLAREMRADGITTSVIGIGTEEDPDTQFLKDVAKAGGGRFYLTADAAKLRSLFVEETERLVDSSLHEIKFRPDVRTQHPAIAGVEYAGGPQLRGYQEVEARSTAEVLLSGPNGDPLLTTWRYGLGQVVAWASDAGPRWSEDWLTWEGYATQWTQLARWALRSQAGSDTAVEVDFHGGRANLRVARRGKDGLALDESGLRARVSDGESSQDVPLRSDEPGLWQGSVRTRSDATYTVEVLGDEEKVLAQQIFAPPPSPERRHRTPDGSFMAGVAEKTGGVLDPKTIEPQATVSATTEVLRLWPWLLLAALALLPFDAFLRRPARRV
jgi:Ca-activated chloride channel family protein